MTATLTLRTLLFSHLLLVLFQIPLRAIIIDTTYLRDVLLWCTLGLWIIIFSMEKRQNIILNSLDVLIIIYLSYGVLTFILCIYNGLGIVEAGREFRNYFLPAALYFVAKNVFTTYRNRNKLINFIFIVFIFYVFDVLIEFLFIKSGFSVYSIPWYSYIFKISERYIGNMTGIPGYILPEYTPVLGLLGWPNATAAVLAALFAFIYPYHSTKVTSIQEDAKRNLASYVGTWEWRGIVIIMFLALIILHVTTHLLSAILVMLLISFFMRNRLLFCFIIIVCLATVLLSTLYYDASPFFVFMHQDFIGTDSSLSSLNLILSIGQINVIIDASIYNLLFGGINISGSDMDMAGGFEMRLLLFTARFGILWLLLFLSIYLNGFIIARKIIKNCNYQKSAYYFSIGSIGLLLVCLLDMGHYARPLFYPLFDLWAIILGALSATYASIMPQNRYLMKRNV